jgi:hypothetical protein
MGGVIFFLPAAAARPLQAGRRNWTPPEPKPRRGVTDEFDFSCSAVRYQFVAFDLRPQQRRLLSADAPVFFSARSSHLPLALFERGGRLTPRMSCSIASGHGWRSSKTYSRHRSPPCVRSVGLMRSRQSREVSIASYWLRLRRPVARRESSLLHNLPKPSASFIRSGCCSVARACSPSPGLGGCGKTLGRLRWRRHCGHCRASDGDSKHTARLSFTSREHWLGS